VHLRGVVGHEIFVVDEAARVRQQVTDRHGLRRGRKLRQPLPDGVVELKFSRFREQQDRRGRELLGHRGQAIVGGGRGGRVFFEIRKTERASNDRSTIAQHEHGCTGDVTRIAPQEVVDLFGCFGITHGPRPGLGLAVADAREEQVFEIRAEVAVGIDLRHRQRVRLAGLEREQGFLVGVVVPVDQQVITGAHDVSRHERRFHRVETHVAVTHAEGYLAEPWIAITAEPGGEGRG
jgi:hypothetical protein